MIDAMARGLITLQGNNLHLRIQAKEAEAYLQTLPGGSAFYDLAVGFLIMSSLTWTFESVP